MWINWVNVQVRGNPRFRLWRCIYNSSHFSADFFLFILAFAAASKEVSNWQLWLVNKRRSSLSPFIVDISCNTQNRPRLPSSGEPRHLRCGVCHLGLWVLRGESPERREQVRIKQSEAIETENGPLSATLHSRQGCFFFSCCFFLCFFFPSPHSLSNHGCEDGVTGSRAVLCVCCIYPRLPEWVGVEETSGWVSLTFSHCMKTK